MRSLTLIVALTVAACATGYHSRGLTGGFAEIRLDDNVFQVSFNGNGYTSGDRAADFTLLRSAELARQNGFSHFIIVEREDRTGYGTYTTPTTSTTTATSTTYGTIVQGSAITTTYGGHTYLIQKPGRSNTIVCFKGKPDNVQALVYNAQYVYDAIASKYGIQPD
jgi:hypothetical protein